MSIYINLLPQQSSTIDNTFRCDLHNFSKFKYINIYISARRPSKTTVETISFQTLSSQVYTPLKGCYSIRSVFSIVLMFWTIDYSDNAAFSLTNSFVRRLIRRTRCVLHLYGIVICLSVYLWYELFEEYYSEPLPTQFQRNHHLTNSETRVFARAQRPASFLEDGKLKFTCLPYQLGTCLIPTRVRKGISTELHRYWWHSDRRTCYFYLIPGGCQILRVASVYPRAKNSRNWRWDNDWMQQQWVVSKHQQSHARVYFPASYLNWYGKRCKCVCSNSLWLASRGEDFYGNDDRTWCTERERVE